jgi:hypothetical protein
MRRIFGVLISAAALLAIGATIAATGSAAGSTVCAPVPNPSGTGYWTPFGTGVWGPSGLLTTSQASAGQPYGVTCGGASVYGSALPTTDPHGITALSFDFNANMTGPSGTSPRIVVCFSDGLDCSSNGSIAPTTWTANTWTHFDGLAAGNAWSNAGGTCGATDGNSFSQIIACHPAATVTQVAIVNDSGHAYPAGEQVLLNNLTFNNVIATAQAPTLAQTALVVPTVEGVFIKRPGARHYSFVRTVTLVPYGTLVNASVGRLQIIAAKRHTGTESGVFYDGSYQLTQGHNGVVQAALINRPSCGVHEVAHSARSDLAHTASGKSFKLFGHVSGKFKTRGHYGSASVLGTIWLTEERCTGTFFHVYEGTLFIQDFTRHKSIVLHAGHSYLAPNALPKKPHDSDGDNDGD